MEWTQEAIRKALDGHFYAFELNDYRVRVVDMCAADPCEPPARTWSVDGNWTAEELATLIDMKLKGFPSSVIAQKLGRNHRRVNEKWLWLRRKNAA